MGRRGRPLFPSPGGAGWCRSDDTDGGAGGGGGKRLRQEGGAGSCLTIKRPQKAESAEPTQASLLSEGSEERLTGEQQMSHEDLMAAAAPGPRLHSIWVGGVGGGAHPRLGKTGEKNP